MPIPLRWCRPGIKYAAETRFVSVDWIESRICGIIIIEHFTVATDVNGTGFLLIFWRDFVWVRRRGHNN